MTKRAVTMRLDETVLDDLNYLNYLMRAKSTAQVVSEVITLVADAVKSAAPDDPELWRNEGPSSAAKSKRPGRQSSGGCRNTREAPGNGGLRLRR